MTPYRERLNAGHYKGSVATRTTTSSATTNDDGAYTCPDCGRTFNSEHGLKVHTAKTHADQEAA